MDPFFRMRDKEMFYRYLNHASVYFEFGSGGSTYQASIRSNIRKIYSVESDLEWYAKITRLVSNHPGFRPMYIEMNTKPRTFGHPGTTATLEQKKSYSDSIVKQCVDPIDLVLIDGRFRVACCLKALQITPPNCVILFDDFLNRPHYHIVLQYCEIVEKTSDNCMVVLRKTKEVPSGMIAQYEHVAD